jgi:tungstate transport system ATP-binding protein
VRATPDDLPILIESVAVRFGERLALDRASADISRGRPTALIGPNGSGKSTLLRVAMGLLTPSEGRVVWGGRANAGADGRAFVFQRPVFLRRSVAANLDYARVAGAPSIADLLARVGLAGFEDRPARRLSGGEQQRLALARGLARRPHVLFLDEPTASLDPASTRAVEEIIAGVADEGVKIVMATHDMGQARRLAGDVVFMLRGRVHEQGAAEAFFSEAASAEARAFARGDLVI